MRRFLIVLFSSFSISAAADMSCDLAGYKAQDGLKSADARLDCSK